MISSSRRVLVGLDGWHVQALQTFQTIEPSRGYSRCAGETTPAHDVSKKAVLDGKKTCFPFGGLDSCKVDLQILYICFPVHGVYFGWGNIQSSECTEVCHPVGSQEGCTTCW